MLELDHVQIVAPPGCETAARGFFGALLGLTEVSKPVALAGRGGVWFALGDGRELHIGIVAADDFVPAAKAHPGFRVSSGEELHRLAGTLVEAGHPVLWAPAQEIPGRTRFHTTDPWGNRLELFTITS
jgi:catechol 2,3-dioxygenase-like lactoylglutathione lyase family enzyme